MRKKINKFSNVGVSICGGVSHNIGQIVVAALIVENMKLFFYLPILLISGALTGAVIGFISKKLLYIVGNTTDLVWKKR